MVAYLDHAASSPLAPGVREAMEPWLFENCANPSALHAFGRKARQAIEESRERIALLLRVQPERIIFTSGGTEANNMAMHIARIREGNSRVVVSAIEHESVLEPAQQFTNITLLAVDKDGLVDLKHLRSIMTYSTALVSVMAVNNEIGTIQPLKQVSKICQDWGIPFHVDAVQAVGHIPLFVPEIGCDFLSVSAHKFGGPKGVGLLYAQDTVPLVDHPWMPGGGQENNHRSGTENVAGIVGMAAAMEYAEQNRIEREERYRRYFNYFVDALRQWYPEIWVNGSTINRTFSNINITIPGVEAEAVLLLLDLSGICASAGSACNASGNRPSHVLKAIGLTDEQARSSLRLTMGPDTTMDDMQFTLNRLVQVIKDLKRV